MNFFFYRHEVLPYAIEKLQKAGYKLVTVAECLGQQPYHSQGPPSARDVCQVFSFFTGVFLTTFFLVGGIGYLALLKVFSLYN